MCKEKFIRIFLAPYFSSLYNWQEDAQLTIKQTPIKLILKTNILCYFFGFFMTSSNFSDISFTK